MTLFDENGNIEHGAIVAENAANGLWRYEWEQAIRRAAATPGGQFTADELELANNLHPLGNAVGGVFRRLRAEGVICCVGYRPSTKPSRAGGVVAIWTAGGAA